MFPFEENVFHECLLLAVRNIIKIKKLYICGNQVEDLYETPSFLWLPGVAGPKFDIETRKVSAAVIEYESSQAFNFNYQEIHNFYTEVKVWFFLLKCTLTCFKLEFLKNTELLSYMTLVADQPKKAFVSNFFSSYKPFFVALLPKEGTHLSKRLPCFIPYETQPKILEK